MKTLAMTRNPSIQLEQAARAAKRTVSSFQHVQRGSNDYNDYCKAHVIVYAQIGDTDLYKGTKQHRWFTIRTC